MTESVIWSDTTLCVGWTLEDKKIAGVGVDSKY